jgi:hypothetical protein
MTNNQQLAAHCRDVIANPQDHLDWVVDMARAALRTIDANLKIYTPAAFTARDAKIFCAAHGVESAFELASQMANYAVDKVVRLNASHTAQIEPICATGGAEWVKCSERMPEVPYHQDQLIVYTDSMIVMAAWFNRIDRVFKDEHNGCVIDDVTHWMPLPAAPEGN